MALLSASRRHGMLPGDLIIMGETKPGTISGQEHVIVRYCGIIAGKLYASAEAKL